MKNIKTFEGFFSKVFGNDAISIAKKMVVGTSDQDGVVVDVNKKPATVEFDGRKFTEDQITLTDDANDSNNRGFEQRQGILPRIVGHMSADVKNRGKLILPKGKLLEIWLKTRGVKN